MQAREGEQGLREGEIQGENIERAGHRKKKVGKANLHTLQTTSSAAWIDVFPHRHSIERHIYRRLSATPLYF